MFSSFQISLSTGHQRPLSLCAVVSCFLHARNAVFSIHRHSAMSCRNDKLYIYSSCTTSWRPFCWRCTTRQRNQIQFWYHVFPQNVVSPSFWCFVNIRNDRSLSRILQHHQLGFQCVLLSTLVIFCRLLYHDQSD